MINATEQPASRGFEATGERLRVARQDAGLSQRDLAGRLGVSQTTVFRFEVGLSYVTEDYRDRIDRVLGAEWEKPDPERTAPAQTA